MRVIAGTAGSLPLKTPEGMDTRPTTDRIKETLFNMLKPLLADAVFVDAFAGSGGIGIEALSRGARRAYFIENRSKAVQCIRKNLEFTRLSDRGVLLCRDVTAALPGLPEKHVEVVFADPPYHGGLEEPFLTACSRTACIGPDTLIILEAERERDFSFSLPLGFTVEREKLYKTNKHVFLRKTTEKPLDNSTVLR